MKNIIELRSELAEVFDDIKAGKLTPIQAKEMNSAAGKIINSVKTEIYYRVTRSEIPKIKFIE